MFRNKTDKWYHVHINEQDIVCTAGHPFYVADLETFVPAKDLKVGQSVLLADGTCATIEEIRVQKLRTPETTYNFEVEDFHTYYVSDDKVLVHNKCGDVSSIKPEIGNKIEYAMGNARGTAHDVRRSLDNAAQLSRIGIHDNAIGREIVENSFRNAFSANADLIMNSVGRSKVYTLIAGPGGFLGMESTWEGNRLITFIFFGG